MASLFAFHQDARCDRHDRRGHCPENLEKQICGQSVLGDFGGIACMAFAEQLAHIRP